MRIIAWKTLAKYADSLVGHKDHVAVRASLAAWHEEVRRATWSGPQEIRRHFATASLVGDRVVFNIKGNDYRLVVAVDYERQWVFVKWVGTHRAYDKIDVRTVQHGD